jgi:hypothetical protein
MNVNVYKKDRLGEYNTLAKEGGYFNSSLVIENQPLDPNEIATVSYVEEKFLNIGNQIHFSPYLFPPFIGLLTSSGNNTIINLGSTGVVPSSYININVNINGRITSANNNTPIELNNLSWSNIVNKPITTYGFGIYNAISVSTSNMQGYLSLTNNSYFPSSLVNKSYISLSSLANNLKLTTGDIVTSVSDTPPDGFLRCNGSSLEKYMYIGLYETIGDRYTTIIETEDELAEQYGYPFFNQQNINSEKSNDFSGQSTYGRVNNIVNYHFVTKNKIYRYRHNSNTSMVELSVANINSSGIIGSYNALPSKSSAMISYIEGTIIVANNRVYVPTYNQKLISYYINNDGTLLSPQIVTNLPYSPHLYYQFYYLIFAKGYMYYIGGERNAGTNNVNYSNLSLRTTNRVWYVKVNTDGTFDGWKETTPFISKLKDANVICIKNKLYITEATLVSDTGDTSSPLANVYVSTIGPNGELSEWSIVPGLAKFGNAIVTSNRLYSRRNSDISYSEIDNDGNIGPWIVVRSSLPWVSAASLVPIVTSSKVYYMPKKSYQSTTVYSYNFSGGKNDYSEDYTVLDTTNTKHGYLIGNGMPWKYQYGISNKSDSDGIFKNLVRHYTTYENNEVPLVNIGSKTVVTKDRIYYLGHNIFTNYIHYSEIDEEGEIGVVKRQNNIPVALEPFSSTNSPFDIGHAIVFKNKIYLISGVQNGNITGAIFMADILQNGVIGQFSILPESKWLTSSIIDPDDSNKKLIPIPGSNSAIVTKTRIYIPLGHLNKQPYNYDMVMTTYIGQNGEIGEWSEQNFIYDDSVMDKGSYYYLIIIKNKVTLLNGVRRSSSTGALITTNIDNSHTASINYDGTLGHFIRSTDNNSPYNFGGIYVNNNRFYIYGGTNSDNLDKKFTGSGYLFMSSYPYTESGELHSYGTLSLKISTNTHEITFVTSGSNNIANANIVALKNRLYLFNNGKLNDCYKVIVNDLAMNSYEQYYSNHITIDGNFTLPDTSETDLPDTYSYIKY